jgi:hypothetical protein
MYDHVPRRVRFEDLCAALAEGRSALDVLPAEVSAVLADAPHPLALADFAGRDSVAAAMAWLAEHEVGTLLPVGDVVPTRYGDWSVYEDNWLRMRDHIRRRHPAVLVAPWFVLEDVDFWRLLNGRYLNELIRAFGFFTPCLGCHLHFYAMRAVLGQALGASVLLSGEKELHGRKRKANQSAPAVEGYAAFSAAHGVDHHFPIHAIRTDAEIETLLGDGWREGERQLQCVMSGNDQGLDGAPTMSAEQIRAYMFEFAVPLATRIVALRRDGVGPADLQRSIDDEARALLSSRLP